LCLKASTRRQLIRNTEHPARPSVSGDRQDQGAGVDQARLGELQARLEGAERSGRTDRGLPDAHLLTMEEFPFKFSDRERQNYIDGAALWAESQPSNPNALIALACAKLTGRDYAAANIAMAKAEAFAVAPLTAMRFGMGSRPAKITLPPVTGRYPKGPSFFLSCDQQYPPQLFLNFMNSAGVTNTRRDAPLSLILGAAGDSGARPRAR